MFFQQGFAAYFGQNVQIVILTRDINLRKNQSQFFQLEFLSQINQKTKIK